ncbi:MAG TPA: endolytic transglycosylase MltG, partial [Terriglobales bacterium]|nr:endolytic transglycosylase MltG [Terriglobales bacterium]
LILLSALAFGGWAAYQLYVPVTPPANTTVLLRNGYSSRHIGVELKRAGVIRSVFAFRLWHWLHQHPTLKAGEYVFERAATVKMVHERIARGDIYFHTVTIPEGYTIFDVAKAMEEAGLGTEQDFIHVVQTHTELISDLDPQAKSLEGYLFPNTYEFTRTQTLEEMAAEMVHQFRQVAQQIGLTTEVARTVTLASIVEKETAVPEERAMVASVYSNRLARQVPLQADPTVIYALLLAGTYSGMLHHPDLAVASPYNTYRSTGLPPGPIANPGRSSLEAAMHPANTQFLYFVADGNGRHRFAQSLEEHNRNVTAYRHFLKFR